MLPLCEEYQMLRQKVDCETCLMLQVERETQPKEGVTYLIIAQKYNLIRLRGKSADLVSKLQLKILEQMSEFNDLDPTYQLAVLKVWENLLVSTLFHIPLSMVAIQLNFLVVFERMYVILTV